MANNCNEACTSSCETMCGNSCSTSCSNLCDNVCTYVCRNICTSSCETICGQACVSTCISMCSGSEMAITNINTFYDKSYMRKITKMANSNNNGYLIYPGLNGKITVYKIVNDFIMGKMAVAKYDEKLHGGTDPFRIEPFATEDSEHMQFDETYYAGPHNEIQWTYLLHDSKLKDAEKNYSAYSILEIERVLYDAMMHAVRGDCVPLTIEDILYIVYNDQTVRKLYYDIQNWSWNNTDSFHHNLIKKPTDPAIPGNNK